LKSEFFFLSQGLVNNEEEGLFVAAYHRGLQQVRLKLFVQMLAL
jgi:hypothetical protein